MLTRSFWRCAPVVAAVSVLGAGWGTALAQEMYRTSGSNTGTLMVDGVPYFFLAVYVQESGDSDGDGVADYEGDSTFTGAVLVDRLDDPFPAFGPPPLSWFPELLDHIRTTAHDPWNQYYTSAGDGFHASTLYSSSLTQEMDFVVNEITPTGWNVSATVTGECTAREGVTLPIERTDSFYTMQIEREGGGPFKLRTTEGGEPLVIDGLCQIEAETAMPPTFDYFTISTVRLDTYNELTGEFGGTCSVEFRAEAPCRYADLNSDGIVDFADYLEFLNLFEAHDLRVDYNGDGLVDFSDYLEFLNLFDACTML